MFAQPVWQSSTTSIGKTSTASIAKPSGLAAGDLMVVSLAYEKGSDEVITKPSSYTLIQQTNNSSDAGIAVYYKVAGASEPANYSWGLANGSKWSIAMTHLTNADPTNIVVNGNTGSGGSLSTPTITTIGADNMVMNFYTNKKDATYTMSGLQTERFDAPNTAEGQPSHAMSTYTKSIAGLTSIQSASPSETEKWVSMTVSIPQSGFALPVEMIGFTADMCDFGSICLNWATGTEINNDYFLLQRTTDIMNWENIGRIDGAGNSSDILEYEFVDDFDGYGLVYYRIVQYDFDGQFDISEVNSVQLPMRPLSSLKIFPNPFADQAKVEIQHQSPLSLDVYDIHGQRVTSMVRLDAESDYVARMQTKSLPIGHYFIRVGNDVEKVKKVR